MELFLPFIQATLVAALPRSIGHRFLPRPESLNEATLVSRLAENSREVALCFCQSFDEGPGFPSCSSCMPTGLLQWWRRGHRRAYHTAGALVITNVSGVGFGTWNGNKAPRRNKRPLSLCRSPPAPRCSHGGCQHADRTADGPLRSRNAGPVGFPEADFLQEGVGDLDNLVLSSDLTLARRDSVPVLAQSPACPWRAWLDGRSWGCLL